MGLPRGCRTWGGLREADPWGRGDGELGQEGQCGWASFLSLAQERDLWVPEEEFAEYPAQLPPPLSEHRHPQAGALVTHQA